MDERLGAYGFRLHGVDSARRWLVPQDRDAPVLSLMTQIGALPQRATTITDEHADVELLDGVRFETDLNSEQVTFTSPVPLDDSTMVHPLLAPVAALQWLWRGREALHAGAVMLGDAAVLLLGARGAGKSTTLSALSEAGYVVLADDMVVVSPQLTMPPGPCSIDRRRDPGIPGDLVRSGERVRMTLTPTLDAAEVPIRAWVQLSWGDDLQCLSLGAADRLTHLARARRVPQLDGDHRTLLDLAALPAYGLSRHRGLEHLAAGVELLVSVFA